MLTCEYALSSDITSTFPPVLVLPSVSMRVLCPLPLPSASLA